MAAVNFCYTARTADGDVVRGAMQALDVAAVVEVLRARALFVTAVDPATELGERMLQALRIGRISRPELLGFFRSFATLIRAGVSIGRALTVTTERTNDARLAEALRSILADVEHGSALSVAMARRPRDFPPLYVAMIRAGETGGILDDVLERLAQFLEREATLRKKVRAALAYPFVVLLAATALIVFIVAKIIPMFADIFESFHVDLPLTTRFLIGAGTLLQSPIPWLTFALTILIATLAMYQLSRTTAGALILDRARLRIPVAGPLLDKAIVARVARMLATLLRSGIDLVSAIDAVIPVAGSVQYARALASVNAAIQNGEPLTRSLIATGQFDPMLLALVRVGEETGLLDEMLLKVAQYFESDVEAAIATLSAVLEPALILVLGSAVGFIVCSVFIPLYSLIGNIAK